MFTLCASNELAASPSASSSSSSLSTSFNTSEKPKDEDESGPSCSTDKQPKDSKAAKSMSQIESTTTTTTPKSPNNNEEFYPLCHDANRVVDRNEATRPQSVAVENHSVSASSVSVIQDVKQNQLLLGLARSIFEETELESLVRKIMLQARGLLASERTRVYLIDNDRQDFQSTYWGGQGPVDMHQSPDADYADLDLDREDSGLSRSESNKRNKKSKSKSSTITNHIHKLTYKGSRSRFRSAKSAKKSETSDTSLDLTGDAGDTAPAEWHISDNPDERQFRKTEVTKTYSRIGGVSLVDPHHPSASKDLAMSDSSSPATLLVSRRKFSKPEDVIFSAVFELTNESNAQRKISLNDLNSAHDQLYVQHARQVAATGLTSNWANTERMMRINEIAKSNANVNCEMSNATETQLVPLVPDSSHTRNKYQIASSSAQHVMKCVLSIPILNSARKILGVAQLINKVAVDAGSPETEVVFNAADVATLEAFSIFCGLGIHNALLYESAMRLMAKQRVALEVLSYHASSSLAEARALMRQTVPAADKLSLASFQFTDLGLSDEETCLATIRMFMDLNLVQRFQISYQVLCRWVLSVKKNYRPVSYHNWRHALNVTQTMFAMLTTGGLGDLFPELEQLALLVATLSHDLDHRGTNNSYQIKTASPLATLYSTSTMEHHHFDQCVMILHSQGNNILQCLSPDEYRHVIQLIQSAILSTDLAQYFRKKDKFAGLLSAPHRPDWLRDDEPRAVLRAILMTACDVAAICKPWKIQRHIAELVAAEFFQQGDLEKETLHETPLPIMDRSLADRLPLMQVGFIDVICLPIYKILSSEWPTLRPLYDGCKSNRDKWSKMTDNLPPYDSSIGDPNSSLTNPLLDGAEENRRQWTNYASTSQSAAAEDSPDATTSHVTYFGNKITTGPLRNDKKESTFTERIVQPIKRLSRRNKAKSGPNVATVADSSNTNTIRSDKALISKSEQEIASTTHGRDGTAADNSNGNNEPDNGTERRDSSPRRNCDTRGDESHSSNPCNRFCVIL